MPDLTLEDADPQDLVDILVGVTAIGGASKDMGLDEQKERFRSLRKRLIHENREHAEALLKMDEHDMVFVNDDEMLDGIRRILGGEDY